MTSASAPVLALFEFLSWLPLVMYYNDGEQNHLFPPQLALWSWFFITAISPCLHFLVKGLRASLQDKHCFFIFFFT